jgi:hypothetical protein
MRGTVRQRIVSRVLMGQALSTPSAAGRGSAPPAKLVQAWLAQPGRRIKLHFIPADCPRLNAIRRLSGSMHRHTTHNKRYSSFKDFSITMPNIRRDDLHSN